MIGTGKYKQFLSIPEAALVWSDLPLELLADAAYPEPGVPLIVGYPDVTARAEALVEATERGTLMDCSRMDPDMPLPSPDRRKVSRKALLEWVDKYWPDEAPSRPRSRPSTAAEAAERPAPPTAAPATPDRLLNIDEVLAMIGSSRTALHHLRKAGFFPEPTHTGPLRWRESVVRGYMDTPTPRHKGRPLPPRKASASTEPDEDI